MTVLETSTNQNGEEFRVAQSANRLHDFIQRYPQAVAITGAGISIGSGIPAYRDDKGIWKSNKPIQHAEFMNAQSMRQRYWARSFSGWPVMDAALPNDAHRALVGLERLGFISSLVTQNVDRLHQKAGQRKVIDLHGRLDEVICMDCGAIETRHEVQQWLKAHNAHLSEAARLVRPDGDADVDDGLVSTVKVPSCRRCGGLMKPNVVFYGSSVEKPVVDAIMANLESAKALLVVGSSLMVYSSYRFCRYAAERGIPIACVNQGVTRADDIVDLKITQDCGSVLQQTLEKLQPT